MIDLITPHNDEHFDALVLLLHDYQQWCSARYAGEPGWAFDIYFDNVDWQRELVSLQQVYRPPAGEFLIALDISQANNSEAVGCIAFKRFADTVCELKHLFVRENHRRQGVARRLVKTIADRARNYGYQTARLEFGTLFTEAKQLYASVGFKECDAAKEIPARLKLHMEFMQLGLSHTPAKR